jgi:ribonuclease HI
VAGSLRNWSRDTFGSVKKEIKKLERELKSLRLAPWHNESSEIKGIEVKLCELFEREEVMARQRSRVEWLREGDRNTAFFHARASARRRTNKIKVIIRNDGSRCTELAGIKSEVESFYEEMFSTEPCGAINEVLDAIQNKVTDNMNDDLCKRVTNEEIKVALFQMGPTKAPGPDGFPALFYQTHWDLIQEEICSAVRGFLEGDSIPEGLCDSVIVLIPKVNNPVHLKNFRPISLCNVLYKIASKVLANRLKVILPELISEHQSAFVPGRLITDNALVAYECLHTIRKQHAKLPFFALKIDMMKAYDRVEWSYLAGCLSKMGFAGPWITMVMRCVTTVRYAVRINGDLTKPVIPTRGIRQGDPISPYLFLLCGQGLSCLLHLREEAGDLKGICNGRLGPPVSHLLFADDSIFFARSDRRSVEALNDTLALFCEGSGQKINRDKSSIFFGPHCAEAVKTSVMDCLGVHNEALQDTYLGMPTDVGRSPRATFNFLFDRVWKKMNSLSDRPLSRKGKEIMIKAVIQAIPTYIMSCFQIPVAVCEAIRRAIADFWWGRENGRKKMHWRSWEWLSSPKSLGGLGFRDLVLFNQAMLGRQAWRLLTDPSSLCARVLKGRYFPNCEFWDAPKPRSSSFTWRSILFGKELVQSGVRWGIGDGQRTNLLTDNWIPGVLPHEITTLTPVPANTKVHFLFDEEDGGWDTEAVHAVFNEEISSAILRIPLSRFEGEDYVSWPFAKYGQYTVRSAYNLARTRGFLQTRSSSGSGTCSDSGEEAKSWKKLWGIAAPGKMLITLWRFAHDCLPTAAQLRRRKIPSREDCVFCNREECVEHTFLFCQYTREVWQELKKSYPVQLRRRNFPSPKEWIFDFLDRTRAVDHVLLAVTCWHLWDARNGVRNGELMKHPNDLAAQIKAYVKMIEQHLLKASTDHRRVTNLSVPRWSPPPEGTVFINVDAALFSSSSRMGVGVVIRNHIGTCLVACSQTFDEVTTPELAEALAIRRAITFAQEEGFDSIILASDCLSVIQRIQSSVWDRTGIGVVIKDIKAMAAGFQSVTFCHISRLLNNSAHILARKAEQYVFMIFRDGGPDCIRSTLCNDLI